MPKNPKPPPPWLALLAQLLAIVRQLLALPGLPLFLLAHLLKDAEFREWLTGIAPFLLAFGVVLLHA